MRAATPHSRRALGRFLRAMFGAEAGEQALKDLRRGPGVRAGTPEWHRAMTEAQIEYDAAVRAMFGPESRTATGQLRGRRGVSAAPRVARPTSSPFTAPALAPAA